MPDEKIRICRKCKSKQLIQEYPKAENWIGFKCLDCGFRWMYDTTRDSIYSEPSNFITMEEANNPLTKDYEKLKEEQSLCGEPDCLCNTWPGNEKPKDSEVADKQDSEIIYAKESFMDLQKMLEQQKIIIGDLKLENKSHQITVNSQDKEIIKYKRYYEDLEYKNKEIEQLKSEKLALHNKYSQDADNYARALLEIKGLNLTADIFVNTITAKDVKIEELHIDISGFEAKYKRQMEEIEKLHNIIDWSPEKKDKEILELNAKLNEANKEVEKFVESIDYIQNTELIISNEPDIIISQSKEIEQLRISYNQLLYVLKEIKEGRDPTELEPNYLAMPKEIEILKSDYQELKDNYLKEMDKKKEMKIFIRELSDQNSWPEDSPWKQKYNKIMEVEY